MDLFALLEKKQSKTAFPRSSEMRFFLDYSGILADYPMFARLSKAQKTFDIIRANIVIRSIINKQTLEDAYEKAVRMSKKESVEAGEKKDIIFTPEALEMIEKVRASLPYLQDGEDRIYIPILPRTFNKIYSGDLSKLSKSPFRALLGNLDAMVIDPFDMYGDALYDSYFTKLVAIRKEKTSTAFWDIDACSIYIVNKQGRIDVTIALFDRGIRHKSPNHMMSRIVPVIDAYYDSTKLEFEKALVDNQLISSRLVYRNRYDERRLSNKLRKKYAK